MQDLHQPPGGNGAFPSATRRVRHHPHDLWTPSRWRVHSQGLLWEEEHLWVSTVEIGPPAIFGGAADVILGGIVWSKIALKWMPLTINVRKTNVFVFPHREAENTIGSDQMQVCDVIVAVVWSTYILIVLIHVAVLKQIFKFTFDVYKHLHFPFTLLVSSSVS